MWPKVLILLCCLSLAFGYKVRIENNGTKDINVTSSLIRFYNVKPTEYIDFDVGSIIQYFTAYHGIYPDFNNLVATQAHVRPSYVTVNYGIVLTSGFNIPLTIVPVNDVDDCKTVTCTENINDVCPEAEQVLDTDGNVTACQYDKELFLKVCPDTRTLYGCSYHTRLLRFIFG